MPGGGSVVVRPGRDGPNRVRQAAAFQGPPEDAVEFILGGLVDLEALGLFGTSDDIIEIDTPNPGDRA